MWKQNTEAHVRLRFIQKLKLDKSFNVVYERTVNVSGPSTNRKRDKTNYGFDKSPRGILITFCARRHNKVDVYKPVMAILADHLLVPSKTDCFMAFMWPVWLFSSTPNTSLHEFIEPWLNLASFIYRRINIAEPVRNLTKSGRFAVWGMKIVSRRK